jgi:hypothetical protein
MQHPFMQRPIMQSSPIFRRWNSSSASGFVHPVGSEITPQAVYLQRRDWLKHMGLA